VQSEGPWRRFLSPTGLARLTQGIDVYSLWRWARLSVLVGIVVGLAAAGLYYVFELVESVLLYQVAGHQEPALLRAHLFSHHSDGRVWWLILLLPAAGGLIAGLLVWRFARETSSHGTDAMIAAYHRRSGRVGLRGPLVRMVATIITLGTGGSAGREGPMAITGAGFGAMVAQRLRLSDRDRRLLFLAGAAGGISALFRSPLGAALWALEILYRDDIEAEGMFPCLVSSVTAYSIFTSIWGQGSLFGVPGGYEFDPRQLLFYGLLALACVPLGLLWIKLFYGTEGLFVRLRIPPALKPALGGLLLGALALGLPWVFASGYGWMQDALRPPDDPARVLPIGYQGFGMLLGLAVAKMLATSLTLGSGGSGGVFAPSLFIGGFIGGAFGLLFHQLAPGIVTQPGAFVLVGMGAFYAGVAHVPLATIILISELFGSYDLLVPLMFAEMITIGALRRFTLYRAQVPTALDSPAHVADFTVDVLEDLTVGGAYSKGRAAEPIPVDMSLADFLSHVAGTAESFFVVADRHGQPVGMVTLGNVRSVVTEQEHLDIVLVGDAMMPVRSVAPGADLRAALTTFMETGHDHLPVIDPDQPHTVLGLLSQRQIFAAYHAEILRRRLGGEQRKDTES
jgi:chloride channel protein, CIC family